MNTIYFTSPPDGDVINNPSKGLLRALFLYVEEEYWCSGSCDSNLVIYKDNQIFSIEIIYNSEYGFYLHYQTLNTDFHSKGQGDYIKTVLTYKGGNELKLPSILFLDKINAFEIIDYFLETCKMKDIDRFWINDLNLEWDWEL